MKRHITIKNLQVIRRFNGVPYQLMSETINYGKSGKKRAEKWAEEQRKHGYLVRVYPIGGGYALYIRKETMLGLMKIK